MTSPESGERYSDADAFQRTIDVFFAAGTPRRHAPGMGLREEEIFLAVDQSDAEIDLGLFAMLNPKYMRLIRPKANDISPQKPRAPYQLAGHRLHIFQSYNTKSSETVELEFYTGLDGQLHRRISYQPPMHTEPVRVKDPVTGITETGHNFVSEGVDYREDEPLTMEGTRELFTLLRYVQPTGPPEDMRQ